MDGLRERTPGPWWIERTRGGSMGAHVLLRHGPQDGDGYIGHLYLDGGAEGDPWFIICAVNAHDELVEALKLARDELERIAVWGGYAPSAGVEDRIGAALTMAEARDPDPPVDLLTILSRAKAKRGLTP
ncbi:MULTISPECIES: hypothetical protein [unclassified Chelatococcus]|uniref:hypothetical protein n=1 Tax=unclassified Chelatococcus TaxID=2638111 RepID=UPI001BCE58F8|nr:MULTISPECIES: hypothetical protein [unclassified Chelatococcus]MBS7697838.1 hypothetical protein [Chelatococcus sp. YT9]MBX3559807.1 hypothetical protein [Chelatococcus sp.]